MTRHTRRRLLEALAATAGLATAGSAAAHLDSYDEEYDGDASTDDSAESIVADLTLEEKIRLVHGHHPENDDGGASGLLPHSGTPDEAAALPDRPETRDTINTLLAPNERVGIPQVNMTDGPAGVARDRPATAFPVPLLNAATWDPELQSGLGRRIGSEVKATGHGAVFAPGLNVARVAVCGRNFEYFGEDPHLASRTTVNVVEGIQSEGVVATAKHFAANNQEPDRFVTNADVSERALREIYFPATRAAVEEAEVGAVMSAYNRLNDVYCSANEWLLTDVLREDWGFEGFVVSDFEATDWAGGRAVLEDGKTQAEAAARMANAGLDFEAPGDSYFGSALRQAVEQGLVSEARLDDMVERVLGQFARMGVLSGDRVGGPGTVDTDEHRAFARHVATQGSVLLENDGTLPVDVDDIGSIAVVGHEADEAATGGGGSSSVDPARTVSPLEGIRRRVGDDVDVRYTPGYAVADAAAVAAASDVAVVVAKDDATEFADREDLRLGEGQDRLIRAVAEANPETAVVLNTPGAVVMPWLDAVGAVLETWYPGQEDGLATADLLFGDVAPSGKLPLTFAERREDYPAAGHPERYPGVGGTASYEEGVFVGYRHFDAADIEPLFPFGHGETYTDFEVSDLRVPASVGGDTVRVGVTLENVGDRRGQEVLQAYAGQRDPAVPRPPKELVSYEKVALAPGERTTVDLSFDRERLAYFDDGWRLDEGTYDLSVGRSSRDLPLSAAVEVR